MSSPLANTRAAASGSTQMLNSAAGVTLPSAIAPPISTIRSIFAAAPGGGASSSAMLVSGPVGTSVTGALGGAQALGQEVDGVRGDRRAGGRREVGPVEPALAVHVGRRRAAARTSGRSAPAATGMSPRPANSSTRRALAVVLASVGCRARS